MVARHALHRSRLQDPEGLVCVAWTVDEVAHAQDRLDVHRFQCIEHSSERFGLAMNIADDAHPAHAGHTHHTFNLGAFRPRAKHCLRLVFEAHVL